MIPRLSAAALLLALNAAPAAPAPAAPPPPAPVEANEGPLAVEYRLTSGPKGETVLIHGAIQAEPYKTAAFEQRQAKSYDQLDLSLKPIPRRDGTVAVEVEWQEGSAEGRIVKWAPSLQGKRGETLRASVNWGTSQRNIELTIK